MHRFNRFCAYVADLFTLRYRSRSQFDSDLAFRIYYAEENARVTRNYMVASLVVGTLVGMLTMWIAMQGGEL